MSNIYRFFMSQELYYIFYIHYAFLSQSMAPFYGCGDWGSEHLNDFLKVTQPQNAKIRI